LDLLAIFVEGARDGGDVSAVLAESRDDLIAHLERHVSEDGIEIRLETRVDRIDSHDGGWRAETDAGAVESAQMVIATGYEGEPVIPE
jgi:cation diffusion facilitator CzcD-associated flavoprotein CzcO